MDRNGHARKGIARNKKEQKGTERKGKRKEWRSAERSGKERKGHKKEWNGTESTERNGNAWKGNGCNIAWNSFSASQSHYSFLFFVALSFDVSFSFSC